MRVLSGALNSAAVHANRGLDRAACIEGERDTKSFYMGGLRGALFRGGERHGFSRAAARAGERLRRELL